ncbi:serine/threonine-protein kinase unc-51-related [Anaeramoeba ignava]|uniref:Serine/threonine-protein kinase unc-51-related n=1 Tax=Anaeramoeba ignava TaxID=1746090 RepID=A0A9Q0RBA3_ANAIG|nr:serine/threonine-protein kinase unc-51-related [Anaeramoeba ignava]
MTICGTPLYMAPEVLREDSYNYKADLWSLGAILYEMITGYAAFNEAPSSKAIRKMHEKNTVKELPQKLKMDVPQECKELVKSLLTVDPNKRITRQEVKNHPFVLPYLNKKDEKRRK